MKMDDVPTELEVEGVKGKRFKSSRYYSGSEGMSVLDVTYRFDLDALVKAGVAKLYENVWKYFCEKCGLCCETSEEMRSHYMNGHNYSPVDATLATRTSYNKIDIKK